MQGSGRYWQKFVIWAMLVVAAYAFWRWMVWYLLPFAIALVVAGMVRPIVDHFERWGLGRATAAALTLGLIVVGMATLSGAILTLLTAELVQLTHRMPEYLHERPWHLTHYLRLWNQMRGQLGLGGGTLNQEVHSLYRLLGIVVRALAHSLVQLPELALMMIIATIAAFFVLRDDWLVKRALKALTPPPLRRYIGTFSIHMVDGIWGYIRAELALISVTALATTGGLLVIRAPYAVLVGLTAGVLDLVPFMGPAALLFVWALGATLTGHGGLAVRLMAVLVVVAVTRQIIEPRLVGHGTGLHPLVVLFSLYLAVRLFGAGGVIIGPMTAVVFQAVAQVLSRPPEVRP